MASPEEATPRAAMAVAKVARKLQELCLAILERCRVTDEETAESGMDLGTPSSGVRNRRAAGPAPDTTDNDPETPTTSATTGTMTPETSGEPSETQDSFPRVAWQRLFDRLGTGVFSRMSAEERKELDRKNGFDKFKNEKLEEYPKGFPQLAFLLSCDKTLAMHRCFNRCHERALLYLEVQITKLEEDLDVLDKKDDVDPNNKHRLRRTAHKEGWNTDQVDLMDKLISKLKEYDEILQKQIFFQALSKPPHRNFLSYYNWIRRFKPLAAGYYEYIYHASDFVSSSDNSPNHFEEFIKDHLDMWPISAMKKFLKGKESEKPAEDSGVIKYSDKSIGSFGRVLLVSTIMGILLIPVCLLFLVPMSRPMMIVTSGSFILLFVLIMSVVTDGKVYEVFVATATYGAVLIMFLGNISQNSSGSGCQ